MKQVRLLRNSKTGVALLSALGMLFLFAMLGASFIAFMSLEVDGTKLTIQKARARQAARGGAQAALGEIQDALAAGRTPVNGFKMDFPVYTGSENGDKVKTRENNKSIAEVTIAPQGSDTFKVTCKGISGSVDPGGVLYHTNSLTAEAVVVIAEGKPRFVSWSEHPAE